MIHVCFCLHDPSGTYSKFVGTAMLSIFENVLRPLPSVTVHILHDTTLTTNNRDKFFSLAGRYNQVVKFYNVERFCADKMKDMTNLFPKVPQNVLSKAVFYKFLIPQVIPSNIDKVISFESNIIVNLDVSSLYLDIGDKMLGVFPAITTGSNVQDKAASDDAVKIEEYFTSSALLMNLKTLRTQKDYFSSNVLLMNLKLSANQSGAAPANDPKYFKLLEQTIWDHRFAQQIMKLPAQLNQFVTAARQNKESVARRIYSYTANEIQLDTNEPFNRLWMEHFMKSPWFGQETIFRLYNGFRQNYNQLNETMKTSARSLSAIMSGKTRVFFTLPANVEMTKQNFSVRPDEEIILAQNQDSIKILLDAMKKAAGKKIFFIVVPNFPFAVLNKAGFVFGKDFMNGWEFLPTPDKLTPLNSYPFVQAM